MVNQGAETLFYPAEVRETGSFCAVSAGKTANVEDWSASRSLS
jgi:hypothetical protein